MHRTDSLRLLLAGFSLAVASLAATPLTTVRVASGLSSPLFATTPAGDTARLFIVEQGSSGTARIKILNLAAGTINATPFLTVTGLATGSEQGLLGLAFAPDYATSGYFYVDYTNSAGDTIVARYHVSGNPDVADAASAYQILFVDQPFSNHNGGWIGFGPDGYLYISLGDGGSGGDPNGNGQSLNTLLGKILRIDPTSDDFLTDPAANYHIPADNPFVGVTGRDEIWVYGLRNPWRDAFDRVTGDLWIADVGQNAWEEIDFQPASSTGGENYGWRCYEGNHVYDTSGCAPMATMTFPIHEYSHSSGCSVTGGYVYRGVQIPDLDGTYFFADYCSATIWSLRYNGSSVSEFTNRTSQLAPGGGLSIGSITGFGEDAAGEVYIVDGGGEVYKIVPQTAPLAGDMNLNQMVDFADINPFVVGLLDPATYTATYGLAPAVHGDLNGNHAFDYGDISPFVDLMVTLQSASPSGASPLLACQ